MTLWLRLKIGSLLAGVNVVVRCRYDAASLTHENAIDALPKQDVADSNDFMRESRKASRELAVVRFVIWAGGGAKVLPRGFA